MCFREGETFSRVGQVTGESQQCPTKMGGEGLLISLLLPTTTTTLTVQHEPSRQTYVKTPLLCRYSCQSHRDFQNPSALRAEPSGIKLEKVILMA